MRYLTSVLLGLSLAAPVAAAPRADATPPERSGPVVRISVEVIQLDVVVTDKKGNHVTDLGPEDFEIREDGRVQEVSHVTYVRAGQPWDDPVASVPASTGTEAPAAASPAPPRTLVLIYDDLGMDLESSVRARRAFESLIDDLLPTDRVAIISTSKWDGELQLTSDKQELHAIASQLRYKPFSREEITIPPTRTAFSYLNLGSYRLDGAQLDWNQRMAIYSLGATKQAIKELKGVEGRKAVILVSEGFPGITTLDNVYFGKLNWAADAAYGREGDVHEALRRLGDFAARASVVVHTMDPRGLMTTGQGVFSASHRSESPLMGPRFLADNNYVLRNSQESLEYLPRQTGGLAIMDSNDLVLGAQTLLADLAGYYLIGYVPSQTTFDEAGRPDFHDIDVKVKRKGVEVRTRNGFYGIADEDL